MTTEKQKPAATGAFIEDIIDGTYRGWSNFITVFFGPYYESYEFGFPCGPARATLAEARANAAEAGFRNDALRMFLEQVQLDRTQPH